jgi:O-methyltransferase involved in polyketide biosynthesis
MITLTKEKETLLVPLYGKAMETNKKNPILIDSKAMEIVRGIDSDFDLLKIPEKTNTMMCMRARLLDVFTTNYLKGKEDVVVLHLGCGLDSRCVRIDAKKAIWYDLDYEEVISIRKEFYPESENYHLIASSVTNHEWIKSIPKGHTHYLIIAEGLFMYLKEKDVKSLFIAMKAHLGNYTLIFDAFSEFAAHKANNHPSIRKTGATIGWGIDSPSSIETWNPSYRFVEKIDFTQNELVQKMNFWKRNLYKLAGLFPVARNAHEFWFIKC